jgi:hypothetical protein
VQPFRFHLLQAVVDLHSELVQILKNKDRHMTVASNPTAFRGTESLNIAGN